jgi:hypothetical protein
MGARGVAAASLLVLASCGGGGGGSTPTTLPSSPSGLGASTLLTVISGETGAPVPGVAVTVGSQRLTTDSTGQVRVADGAGLGSLIDFVHPAYLDRQTTVRAGVAQHTLWPRTSPSGMNEHYTATIVYTYASNDPPSATGSTPLIRLARGTTQVVVVPSAEILADGAAMEAHYRAAQAATDATAGEVAYLLAPSRPAAGVVFTSVVDASISYCVQRTARAVMFGTYRGLELTGGNIVFCELAFARASTVTHEFGHTLGLQHSPEPSDVMGVPFSNSRMPTFGARESLAVRLTMQRSAGNRYPDNDRPQTAAASAPPERTVACR